MFKNENWKNHFKISHFRNKNHVVKCYIPLDREKFRLLLNVSLDNIPHMVLEILADCQNGRKSPVSILKNLSAMSI